MKMYRWKTRLMFLLLLLLTVVATIGAQTSPRQSSVMSQLYAKYGYSAGYIIFHFFLYLGNPEALQRRLQIMRANGQLLSLCQYIPRYPPQCPKTTSRQDQTETVLLVAYLNTVCCQTGQAVNGGWGSWGSWSSCSVSCDSGIRRRFRNCDSPPPSSGGQTCMGPTFQTSSCYSRPCGGRSACGRYKPRGKILGGVQSVPGRYPWVAMLLSSGQLQCGCSIIDQYHVLTAGHCLDGKVKNNRLNSNTFEIIAGQFSRDFEPLERGAQRMFVVGGLRHPDYNSLFLLNDIAVLRLARPLVFTDNVSSVCLPSANAVLPRRCTVAGWGTLTYFGKDPKALQEVELDTYTSTRCEQVFQGTTSYNVSRYLTPGVMCAANGTSGGQDSCRGDSGGALMCVQVDSSGKLFYSEFGIVSSGFGCGSPGRPGFYTYVPYYLNWIHTTVAALSSRATGRG